MHDTIEWQNNQPIGKVTWVSPADMAGRAGIVSVTWKNGFRLIPEMQTLYKNLQQAGVDVYVISASALDVIKASLLQKNMVFLFLSLMSMQCIPYMIKKVD